MKLNERNKKEILEFIKNNEYKDYKNFLLNTVNIKNFTEEEKKELIDYMKKQDFKERNKKELTIIIIKNKEFTEKNKNELLILIDNAESIRDDGETEMYKNYVLRSYYDSYQSWRLYDILINEKIKLAQVDLENFERIKKRNK